MPHVSYQLDLQRGPLVELLVGISTPRQQALQKAGLTPPSPIMIRFLIDTGASCTVLDQTSIAPLGLVPTGQTRVNTPTTGAQPESRFQYDVGVLLYHADNSRMFHNLPIIATDLSNQGIGGLLGRDILQKCLLIYDGSAGTFALAF